MAYVTKEEEKKYGSNWQSAINAAVREGRLDDAARFEQARNDKINSADYGGRQQTTDNYSQYLPGTNSYSGTNYHHDAKEAAREYASKASSGQQGDWSAVLDALAKRDEKVSAIGTDYGKSSDDILRELYDLYYAPYTQQQMEIPSYEGSRWDSTVDRAAEQLLSMNYDDWTKTDQYAALASRYGLQGKMSMQDVVGQISSRTGGLASSYATTAAQQQYNEWMAQLEEVARQMYAGDRTDLMQNMQLAQGLADRDYDRYLNDRDYAYQLGRDQLSDSRYDQEYTDSMASANRGEAQDRINAYLAAGGSANELDADLIAASGMTPAELAAQERYYAQQIAAGKKSTEETTEQESKSYQSVLSRAKKYDDITAAASYLESMVNSGYITLEEARYIYQVELGGTEHGFALGETATNLLNHYMSQNGDLTDTQFDDLYYAWQNGDITQEEMNQILIQLGY